MTSRTSDDKFPLAEVTPAFSGSLVPAGGDGPAPSDRRRIADHTAKQVAGIAAQHEKAHVMRLCLTDSLQETQHLFQETQHQLHRTEQKRRGKPYTQRILDFHGRLSQAQAAYLLGSLKLEAETMALVLSASPFPPEPERPKGLLDRLRGK